MPFMICVDAILQATFNNYFNIPTREMKTVLYLGLISARRDPLVGSQTLQVHFYYIQRQITSIQILKIWDAVISVPIFLFTF